MRKIIYRKLVAFTYGETTNLHEVLTLAVDGNLSAKTSKSAVKEMRSSLGDKTLKPKNIYRVTVERLK